MNLRPQLPCLRASPPPLPAPDDPPPTRTRPPPPPAVLWSVLCAALPQPPAALGRGAHRHPPSTRGHRGQQEGRGLRAVCQGGETELYIQIIPLFLPQCIFFYQQCFPMRPNQAGESASDEKQLRVYPPGRTVYPPNDRLLYFSAPGTEMTKCPARSP